MSLLDYLLGHSGQTTEQQPIGFNQPQQVQPDQYNQPPLQPNYNLGQDGQPITKAPLLKQIMMNNNGSLMPQPDINKFYQNGQNGIYPQVTNQQITDAVQQPNQDDVIGGYGLQHTPATTGVLQDFANGYKDNLTHGFDVNNLKPDENKTWAGAAYGVGHGMIENKTPQQIVPDALTTGALTATMGIGLP